jgi:hypothetical protein
MVPVKYSTDYEIGYFRVRDIGVSHFQLYIMKMAQSYLFQVTNYR